MNWLDKLLMPVYGLLTRGLIGKRFKQLGLVRKSVSIGRNKMIYIQGGQGPALVLLHGFGANKENWLAVVPSLMKQYTVYVPDLIGFGESDKPLDIDYTIGEQAKRVMQWADAIGLKRFHVGGNSMGGYLAGVLAGQYTDRIDSAWLLNPAGVDGAEHSEVSAAFKEHRDLLLVPANYAEYLNVVEMCFSGKPPPMPDFMRKYFGAINIADHEVLTKVFWDFTDPNRNPTLNTMLMQATCKVLVVWGDQDRLVHVSGLEILKQQVPGIQTQLLEQTGHCPMIDRKKPVLEAFAAFQAG